MNVYLVGFMGCGKSTVGKILAKELRMKFYDSDRLIERAAGKSVARFFSEKGERSFRRLERGVISRLSREKGAVVALGGGALLDPRNRRLAAKGRLVLLSCSREELWRRLKPRLGVRPLLSGGRPAFDELLRRRRGLYEGADIVVSTTRRGPRAAARLIAGRLRG